MSRWSRTTDEGFPLLGEPVFCRFAGCDEYATETIATVALCALHRSYVEGLLDSGESRSEMADIQAGITVDGASGVR